MQFAIAFLLKSISAYLYSYNIGYLGQQKANDDSKEIIIPYTEFMENNEEGMNNHFDAAGDESKVRRQISD